MKLSFTPSGWNDYLWNLAGHWSRRINDEHRL